VEGTTKVMLRAERAVALADGGKVDEALKAFDAVIESEKESDTKVRLYFGKAQVLLKAERKEEAGKVMDAAIEVASSEELKEQLREIKSNMLQTDAPKGDEGTEPQEEPASDSPEK
jgi:predicted RNA polymerase sigma factor